MENALHLRIEFIFSDNDVKTDIPLELLSFSEVTGIKELFDNAYRIKRDEVLSKFPHYFDDLYDPYSDELPFN